MVERKYNYFYKVTNRVNGKIYFGIHSSDLDPKRDPYLGSGAAICQAVSKYGKENFFREDLEFFENRHQLSLFETLWIDSVFIKQGDNYNLKEGGDPNIYFGGSFLPEICKKISDSKVGKPRSEETRKKLSKAIRGKVHGYDPVTGKCIFVDEVDWSDFEREGFVKGRPKASEKLKQRLREKQGNRSWMHKDGVELRVLKEDVDIRYKEGWLLGRNPGLNKGRVGPMKGKHHSESSKLKSRLASTGKIRIHRGDECRYIKPELWETYKAQGFEKGSGKPSPKKGTKLSEATIQKLKARILKPVSDETREKISKALRGKKRGPVSEEVRKKLSESHKGIKRSQESIRKQQETRRLKKAKKI